MSRQGHLIGSTMGAISIQIVPVGRFVKGFSYELRSCYTKHKSSFQDEND